MEATITLSRTKDGYWADQVADDGRTMRLGYGRTKRRAIKSLVAFEDHDIITAPDGLRRLLIPPGQPSVLRASNLIDRMFEHLGIPLEPQPESNVSQ